MPRTLVFDLGGVVLRWEPASLLLECLPRRLTDLAAAERLASVFFQSFHPGSEWVEFDRGRLGEDEVGRSLARRLDLSLAEVGQVLQAIPAHLTPKPATVALLRELKAAGQRLVYLSNLPAPFRDTARRHIEDIDVFETGLFSSEVHCVKPEPEMFRAALARFDARADHCLLVDDSPINIAGARHAGWQVHRFADAGRARDELQALGYLAPTAPPAGP